MTYSYIKKSKIYYTKFELLIEERCKENKLKHKYVAEFFFYKDQNKYMR